MNKNLAPTYPKEINYLSNYKNGKNIKSVDEPRLPLEYLDLSYDNQISK